LAAISGHQRLGDAAIDVLNDFRHSWSGFPSTRPLRTLLAAPICSVRRLKLQRDWNRVRTGLVFTSIGVARTSIWLRLPRKAKPDGLVVVHPDSELISFTTCVSS
jgi:hypothetical protein